MAEKDSEWHEIHFFLCRTVNTIAINKMFANQRFKRVFFYVSNIRCRSKLSLDYLIYILMWEIKLKLKYVCSFIPHMWSIFSSAEKDIIPTHFILISKQ